MSELFAFQANRLVEQVGRVSLNEKRFLLLGIRKVTFQQSLKGVQDKPLEFDVTAREWQEHCGGSIDWAYKTLTGVCKSIMRKPAMVDDGLHVPADVSWFDSCHYVRGEARVHVIFGWSISKYLVGFSDEFTRLDVDDSLSFSSYYALRLYELLSQYRGAGVREIELQDFRRLMGIDEGSYPEFANLKAQVIVPALRQVNARTNANVQLHLIRKGRRVGSLRFSPLIGL